MLIMWEVVTGNRLGKAGWRDWAESDEISALAAHPDQMLRGALVQLQQRLGRAPSAAEWLGGLTLKQAASRNVSSTRRSVDLSSQGRVNALALVNDRRERFVNSSHKIGFDAPIVDEALDRLQQRVAEGEATRHLLKRRVARWRTAPSRALVGAPVIDADTVEVAVVAILAATSHSWQFSSTPAGHVFLGRKSGYHREDERLYVSGLSDIVDTTSGVIETHRAGAGGRVFITATAVECAECNLVMAWIQNTGHRRTAFRACSALAASASAQARRA